MPRVHIYWYINLGAYFLLKCLRLSWVWPAAPKSVCMSAKSDFFVLFLIKMFAFVVGVACGAQKCLYFTSKITCSRYF